MTTFYEKYKETILLCRKKHYAKHMDEEKAYARQYALDHPEKRKEYAQRYLAKEDKYQQHKEAVKRRQQRKRDFMKEFQRLANLADI